MTQLNLSALHLDPIANWEEEEFSPLRTVGITTLAIGAVTLGLFVGRELRFRYKFRHRTPYDFFSNAADPITCAEYGVGI